MSFNKCPKCDSGDIKFSMVEIKVGDHKVPVEAEVCQNCQNYLMTRKVEKQIENWGNNQKTNIASYQPLFKQPMYDAIIKHAKELSIDDATFVKIATLAYLEALDSNSKIISLCIDNIKKSKFDTVFKEFEDGPKSKRIQISVKYELYKKIKLYCDIHKVTPAFLIEESTNFLVVILTVHQLSPAKYFTKKMESILEEKIYPLINYSKALA